MLSEMLCAADPIYNRGAGARQQARLAPSVPCHPGASKNHDPRASGLESEDYKCMILPTDRSTKNVGNRYRSNDRDLP